MRGWGWIGGAVVVLVGVALAINVVRATRGTTAETKRPLGVARAAAHVVRSTTGARVRGEVRIQNRARQPGVSPIVRRLERDRGDALAGEIDRQRSAMRAAVALLVAGEHAETRIR